MRILFVGNYVLDNQLSMSRYAEFLRGQMSLRGHHVEVVRPQPVFGDIVRHPAARKWLGYIDKYLLFPLNLRARSRSFDLVHICDHSNSVYLPYTAGRPASITCHDLLAIASARGCYPQQKISSTGKLQQRWIRKHLAHAVSVVCVSRNTANEFAEHVSRAPALTVVPNPLGLSGGQTTQQSVERLRDRLGLQANENYLLHVGSNHWYKNRIGVLRIYQALRRQLHDSGVPELHLVMAGEPFTPQMRGFVNAHSLQSSVIEVSGLTDEDLRALYTGAVALLFPSLYEGFGWPIIEAQSCGCPVITSNRPPMTEVAGDSALFVEPENEQAAAAYIAANLHRLPSLREASLRNVSRFEPGRIALQYETFFASVARCHTLDAASPRTDSAYEEQSRNL